MKHQVVHMDCLAGLRMLPDNFADSIVTDPPYGLSFMGRKWDYDVPAVEVWAECLRVLKPGGHLLAFAGTRTQHRMAVRIEDAGFEIRDMIAWVYGSGFPKSLDVSKAIDKAGGRIGQSIIDLKQRLIALADASSKTRSAIDAECGFRASNYLTLPADGKKPDPWVNCLPPRDKWATMKRVLGADDSLDVVFTHAEREVVGVRQVIPGVAFSSDGPTELDITAPATDAARQWQGWGTALKPALEPITVARKPLAGTVAENVLKHGTGALNIDGCRVGEEVRFNAPAGNAAGGNSLNMSAVGMPQDAEGRTVTGRWPANLIHDGSDEVLATFPQAPGQLAKASTSDTQRGGQNVYGDMARGSNGSEPRNDAGSAARFFQTCKSVYDDDLWQDLNLSLESANTAARPSNLREQAVFSALAAVVKKALPEESSWAVSLSAPLSMNATPNELRSLAESLTRAIQTIDSRFWLGCELARLTQMLNPAQSVVSREQTDITTITLSHWKSDGSAEPVTFNITRTNSEAGAKDCAQFTGAEHARFKYCAKASKADRGADNNHPTVKPTDLMRYLCRLVTPPGGMVLDPFTGSGSTGKAAALEGFRFIGFEREAEYVAIARARIANVVT